jgi:hypothetical protein
MGETCRRGALGRGGVCGISLRGPMRAIFRNPRLARGSNRSRSRRRSRSRLLTLRRWCANPGNRERERFPQTTCRLRPYADTPPRSPTPAPSPSSALFHRWWQAPANCGWRDLA